MIKDLLIDNNKGIREEINQDICEAKQELLQSINSTFTKHQEQIMSHENEELQDAVLKTIVELMNEAVNGINTRDIDFLHRIGRKRTYGNVKSILVRFVCLHKKEYVLKKWIFFKSKNIDIYEDFPVEIRERRKEILPMVKLLKVKLLYESFGSKSYSLTANTGR